MKNKIKNSLKEISQKIAQISLKEMSNPTILASGLVILTSLTVGIITGMVAYYLGSDSLKNVNTPAENPSQKINTKEEKRNNNSKFTIIPEKKVIVTVYDYVHQQQEASKVKKSKN